MLASIRRERAAGGAAALLLLLLASSLAAPARAGSFSVLTYNVAGLPEGFSGSNPSVNIPLISPLLNDYDLVVVQEDFAYHTELVSQATHPYQSVPGPTQGSYGDGLSRFSVFPFTDHTRIQWTDCFGTLSNGSDCLTPKGFSAARHELAPGAFVDVYNFHADAANDAGSIAARQSNLRQLADYIVANSAGNAVLVMGDSNSRYWRATDIVPEFVETTGVSDVWIELVRGGVLPEIGVSLNPGCDVDPAGYDCELIDKIFWRSSSQLELTPLSFTVPDEDFTRSDGEPLSDHHPLSVTFGFTLVPEPTPLLLVAVGLVGLVLRRGA